MHHRTDTLHLRQCRRRLAIRRVSRGAATLFCGSIDGRDCMALPTREAAMGALLRRVAHEQVF